MKKILALLTLAFITVPTQAMVMDVTHCQTEKDGLTYELTFSERDQKITLFNRGELLVVVKTPIKASIPSVIRDLPYLNDYLYNEEVIIDTNQVRNTIGGNIFAVAIDEAGNERFIHLDFENQKGRAKMTILTLEKDGEESLTRLLFNKCESNFEEV
jgi:hypothetical protein